MSYSLVNHPAVITYTKDSKTGIYTFALLERGGPIVFANSIEEGKEKIKNSVKVALAVRNMNYFDDQSFFSKLHNGHKRGSSAEDSYEFVELQLAS